jgi:hypothetical protein
MMHRIAYFTLLQLVVYTVGLLPIFVVYQNAGRELINNNQTAAIPVQAPRSEAFPVRPEER